MTYRIVCIAPTYCQFTDAIIGSQAIEVPGRYYETEALAGYFAAHMTAEVDNFGDEYFKAVPVGVNAFEYKRFVPAASWEDDDMPF